LNKFFSRKKDSKGGQINAKSWKLINTVWWS
jgi:hypothetical protein